MYSMLKSAICKGIQSADSIHAINLFTSGRDIRSVYSQCHPGHVDSFACTEQNVSNQTLTHAAAFH